MLVDPCRPSGSSVDRRGKRVNEGKDLRTVYQDVNVYLPFTQETVVIGGESKRDIVKWVKVQSHPRKFFLISGLSSW